MDSYEDLVAADDVLLFVNAAISATGQREFHSDQTEQRLSLDFLHAYMLENYRDLYARALALDINDHNAALIIQRLLGTTADTTVEQRRDEGRLIAARLAMLPPQRVYRLFNALRRAGVNNRRCRAIIRDWLSARPDPAFDAVKYRNSFKRTLRHAHLAPATEELGAFLFAPLNRPHYATPIFETWRRAHYEQAALYELPYTVAEGFAAKHGVPRDVFLERMAPRLTRLETLRLQESTRIRGVSGTRADLAAMPLTRLATYVVSLPLEERRRRRRELTFALESAADKAIGSHRGSWGRVTAVLDDSFSSFGSVVKRRRPLAVALACHHMLARLAGDYTGLWTSGRTDALLAHPYGPTPLGRRILDALETEPARLVIISDGWDNAPPGLAEEVLRIWRTRLDPGRRTSVVHLNPVYNAADFDVRRLSVTVPTAGIRDAEDLPTLVELAQFAEGRTGLADLIAYLDTRVTRMLSRHSGRRRE